MGGRKNDGDMGIVDVGSFSAFGQSPDQQASRSDASASSEGKGKGGDCPDATVWCPACSSPRGACLLFFQSRV